MPQMAGVFVVNPERAWGTPETIDLIELAVNETLALFPGSPDVIIGDISKRHGGPLPPHRSHRSGRDVDFSYFPKIPLPSHFFTKMTPITLDVERTWHFLETLLLTDRVQYIFIDRSLQKPLYEYVQMGYSKERLSQWFQYPRSASTRQGVIRHVAGHSNHIHVRFKCPETDDRCVP